MGKRRSLKPHERFDASDDDDDETYDEVKETEPLTPLEISQIQSRKKLTAKRRIASTNESANDSPFTGFAGFKSLIQSTPVVPTKQAPSSHQQQNGFTKLMNGDDSTEPKQVVNAQHQQPTSMVPNVKQPSQQQQQQQQQSSNLSEIEINFINELNSIYTKYYGVKRDYTLPTATPTSSSSTQNDDKVVQYANMLMELNKKCSKWIQKNVDDNPFVYLTPIFIDYFNYLIKLEKQFFPATFVQTPATEQPTQVTSTIQVAAKPTPVLAYQNGIGKADDDATTKPAGLTNFKFTSIQLTTTTTNVLSSATTPSLFTQPIANTSATTSSSSSSSSAMSNTQLGFNSMPFDVRKPDQTTQIPSMSTATPPTTTTTTDFKLSFMGLPKFDTKIQFNGGGGTTGSEDSISKAVESKPMTSSTFQTSLFSFPKAEIPTPTVETVTPKVNTMASATSAAAVPSTSGGGFFSFLSNTNPTTTSSAKPFSFGSIQSSSSLFPSLGATPVFGGASVFDSAGSATANDGGEGGDGDNEQYEPPKPEFDEIKEEGSLYTKRIKLYFFNTKENKYTDRGIGNLHLKELNNGEKTQLIVRADTSLGNILLNVALKKELPINKISAKDVSVLCIANPAIPNIDSTKPCKFLFKVKTEDDANELFEKLNEMKK